MTFYHFDIVHDIYTHLGSHYCNALYDVLSFLLNYFVYITGFGVFNLIELILINF